MVLLLQQISFNTRKQGAAFEQRARKFLEKNGLKFIAQNQFFKSGELDLIMQENTTWVFVEVRQRKDNKFGSALESINFRKQQKWKRAANLWLSQRDQCLDTADCRFDVVVFEGNAPPLWIKNFLG